MQAANLCLLATSFGQDLRQLAFTLVKIIFEHKTRGVLQKIVGWGCAAGL